jgi:hypothetical protein
VTISLVFQSVAHLKLKEILKKYHHSSELCSEFSFRYVFFLRFLKRRKKKAKLKIKIYIFARKHTLRHVQQIFISPIPTASSIVYPSKLDTDVKHNTYWSLCSLLKRFVDIENAIGYEA